MTKLDRDEVEARKAEYRDLHDYAASFWLDGYADWQKRAGIRKCARRSGIREDGLVCFKRDGHHGGHSWNMSADWLRDFIRRRGGEA